ncbi:MAG TPA: prepilin-type N-terminal cleavage/methylation domain-containing protein [Thiotrichales bacterium]|nr:prepilin-type N-terminal cleavage/methylation domain-containing protein [Thiotrichales bacterium]
MEKAHGFTLVELMVTVAIAAILLATGLPAMQNFIKDNRIVTATNELVTALQLARTAAVQYGTSASVCVSKTQSGCSGSNWRTGWLVWVDKNRNGSRDAGEEIQYFNALDENVRVTAPAAAIRYDDRGNVSAGTGSFTICDDRTGETGRRINVRITGRVWIERDVTCS